MSIELVCPECGDAFPREDYCPRHGARLVPATPPGPLLGEATPPIEQQFEQGTKGRFAGVMEKLGLRFAEDRSESSDSSKVGLSPLPETALEQGWKIVGTVDSLGGGNRWPVEQACDSGLNHGRFHRFNTGALTTDAVYHRLKSLSVSHLARVLDYGTVGHEGVRADYELVQLPSGTSLMQWFKDSSPSEERAWQLLTLLSAMLHPLEQQGIRPIVIEPHWLQISADGSLCLTTASALTETSTAQVYRPDFSRSVLLPRNWSAPELIQQGMLSTSAAVFSVGQLLSYALWGQPRSIDEVQTGAVPFAAITDTRLARVMMGCLWPRPERWNIEQLLQAFSSDCVEDMPPPPAWKSLLSGASRESLVFAGVSYWRLEDLLDDVNRSEHWDEAVEYIDDILAWAEGTAWRGQVKLMHKSMKEGRSADWVLVALTRAVLPDTPQSWRGIDLSHAEASKSLVALAQGMLNGNQADSQRVQLLFEADLRGSFDKGL